MTKVIIAKTKIDCEHLLGQFLDESHFDTVINEDTDCFFQSEDESNIAFKFRKNYFSKEQQDAAYAGLREAATQTQNRGLAAGPKGEKCGGREWVTEFQLRAIDYLKKQAENSVIQVNVKEEIESLRARYENEETSRGLVWLNAKVKEDEFDFETWLKKVVKMPIKERKLISPTPLMPMLYSRALLVGLIVILAFHMVAQQHILNTHTTNSNLRFHSYKHWTVVSLSCYQLVMLHKEKPLIKSIQHFWFQKQYSLRLQ